MNEKYCVIDKNEFKDKNIIKKLYTYLDIDKNKKTVIFDIHNTLEFNEGEIDQTIYKFIKKNYKKINIVLLSYDGNSKRIIQNYNIINNISPIFSEIPFIFIKKRKKHHIIFYISKIVKEPILFVDDNYKNIIDAKKIKKRLENLYIIHYTAHVKEKYNTGIIDIYDKLYKFIKN